MRELQIGDYVKIYRMKNKIGKIVEFRLCLNTPFVKVEFQTPELFYQWFVIEEVTLVEPDAVNV